jgi:peptide deformylase
MSALWPRRWTTGENRGRTAGVHEEFSPLAVRPILTSEKPVLHQKARPVQRVDGSVRKLLDDMVETMRAAPGVGLAGPQIGVLLRVVVIEYDEKLYKLVNPEITWTAADRVTADEGCLSIPGYQGAVERHQRVKVRAKDHKGKNQFISAEDWLARILQHEIDHLDGILYTDRMAPGERLYRVEETEEVTRRELAGASGD